MSSVTTKISDEMLDFWSSTNPFNDVSMENVETPLNEHESRNDTLHELNNPLTTIPQVSTVHKNSESNSQSSWIPTTLNRAPEENAYCVNDIENIDFDYTRIYTSLNGLHEVEESTGKITLWF